MDVFYLALFIDDDPYGNGVESALGKRSLRPTSALASPSQSHVGRLAGFTRGLLAVHAELRELLEMVTHDCQSNGRRERLPITRAGG
jgi:hypothetical protein